MLIPNNKQKTRMFQTAGCARFAYNWAVAYEEDNYKAGGKFITDASLRKIFTQLRHKTGYEWLNSVSNNATKQAIKDACIAYKRFFDGKASHPQFKKRRNSRQSFYVDAFKIQVSETHVRLEKLSDSKRPNKQKLNWVKLAEHNRIPINAKYHNPRVTFDGLHWWLSVAVEKAELDMIPTNPGIGIDIGVKNLAVCSDGNTYPNINKSRKMKRLAKKKRRLQRMVSKKYLKNRKGGCYRKTRNIIKSENKLLRVSRNMTNIRNNYLHQITSEIINRKPRFIVLENLNVKGMMKNRHLAKAVQEQCFREFRRQIEYKGSWNHVQIIIADRFFPSSKTCSCCGAVKSNLTLNDRIFVCASCGFAIDRDFQAAVNLARYGETQISNAV